MARRYLGRHRAPTYSPLNEIADIAVRSTQPAVKVSAVALASGGLVAAFALPAAAAPSGQEARGSTVGTPAIETLPEVASRTVAVAAPVVDEGDAPTFGVLGFTAQPAPPPPPPPPVAQPAPAPPPAPAPSRAAARPAPAPAAPAPRAQPAAPARVPAPPPTVAAPAPTGGILAIAASLSGIPYRWGGTTPAGFDCSGFTGYVYAQVGKILPRTAEAQRLAATKVSNPVPGDLIFFGAPAYHVGIYAGGGKMYDSQRPGTTSGLHVIWTQVGVTYGRF